MRQRQKGIATYILILLMGVLAVMLLSVISSRVLLAITRGETLSDDLISGYEAESNIYDMMDKLVYGWTTYTWPFTQTYQVNDQTKITISGTQTGDLQNIYVTVQRPYAVTKLEGSRNITTTQTTQVQPLQIILVLDCTSSMDNISAPSATTTRFDELKRASLGFVEAARGKDIKIGALVYGIDSGWLLDSSGRQMTPTNDTDTLEAALNYGFGSTRDTSPACRVVTDNTSIGTGFASASEYLAANKITGTKQIEVLITDGLPNSREPFSSCYPGYFCPESSYWCSAQPHGWTCESDINGNQISGSLCEIPSRDFLRCSMAPSNETYTSEIDGAERAGIKDPTVDLYAVTVISDASIANEVNGQEKFDKAVAIFNRYAKKYYNSGDATQLTDILQGFFTDIISSSSTITIRKIIATP